MLFLVECKNYTHAVPVDDTEEFFSKVQQVAAANVKAVIASTASYQRGARAFAKSKGMGLLRYFDPSNFKWELMRSPSASIFESSLQDAIELDAGLSKESFVSTAFDLYLQSPVRDTNSLWSFVEDFVVQIPMSLSERRKLVNPKSNLGQKVPFQSKDRIEEHAAGILKKIGHERGLVSLDDLCALERERCNLSVQLDVEPAEGDDFRGSILGRISFDPLEIKVFAHARPNKGRERFTLAHELAHHLLGHSRFMAGEACEEVDFLLFRKEAIEAPEISRMEFQADYFAASLLMPRVSFEEDFRRILHGMNLPDRGHGLLYVDDQPCNRQNYEFVTNHLMARYGVSRSATAIRLEGLGLFRDARSGASFRTVGSLLSGSLGRGVHG